MLLAIFLVVTILGFRATFATSWHDQDTSESEDDSQIKSPFGISTPAHFYEYWDGERTHLNINAEKPEDDDKHLHVNGQRTSNCLLLQGLLSTLEAGLLLSLLSLRQEICSFGHDKMMMFGLWLVLILFIFAEGFSTIFSTSFALISYIDIIGCKVWSLRGIGMLSCLLPFVKFLGLLLDKLGGHDSLEQLCNTTEYISLMSDSRWLGAEIIPSALLLVFTMIMYKLNQSILSNHLGRITIM